MMFFAAVLLLGLGFGKDYTIAIVLGFVCVAVGILELVVARYRSAPHTRS